MSKRTNDDVNNPVGQGGAKAPNTASSNTAVQPPVPQSPDIHVICQQIIKTYQAKIIEIQKLDYGWEGWLQVELGLALAKTAEFQGSQPKREVTIYKKETNRCDLWFPKAGNLPNIGIELKTKTKSSKFVTEFVKDYTDKCQVSVLGNNAQGLKTAYDSQQPGGELTWVWGIGITTDKAEADSTGPALLAQAFSAGDRFTQGLLTLFDSKLDGNAQYLVWWRQRF